jgi:hypothetical protein
MEPTQPEARAACTQPPFAPVTARAFPAKGVELAFRAPGILIARARGGGGERERERKTERVCVCTLHTCMHTCIHTYIHTYIRIHTYTCIRALSLSLSLSHTHTHIRSVAKRRSEGGGRSGGVGGNDSFRHQQKWLRLHQLHTWCRHHQLRTSEWCRHHQLRTPETGSIRLYLFRFVSHLYSYSGLSHTSTPTPRLPGKPLPLLPSLCRSKRLAPEKHIKALQILKVSALVLLLYNAWIY